jgi:hypothetical protein
VQFSNLNMPDLIIALLSSKFKFVYGLIKKVVPSSLQFFPSIYIT